MKIFSIIKIDDLFHDHSALKRELRKGRTTSKPESNSMMYFDMQIRVNSNLIYDSWQKKDPEYKVLSFPTNFEEEKEEDFNFLTNNLKCLCIFLDEFRFSKVLKTALKRTKKGEIAEIICTDMTLVNKGIDKEVVDTLTEKPNQLRYLIKLYNFVEGKNSFTMSLDEKIENAKRKKQIGLDLIKKNQYKRALKSFENINSYFELGTFSKEDMLEIKNVKNNNIL